MTPSFLPLEGGLGFRLDRLVRALRAGWAAELAGIGLTPPQAAVLRGVAGADGVSVRALARRLGGDPMNVKRCADELEQRSLLRSGTDAGDRRPRVHAGRWRTTPPGSDGGDSGIRAGRRPPPGPRTDPRRPPPGS